MNPLFVTLTKKKKKREREREMAFRFVANNMRSTASVMRRRNFASAAAAGEKGFVEKFVPVEVCFFVWLFLFLRGEDVVIFFFHF